jgi:hypothetical protein
MSDVSARFGITEPSADRHDSADVPLYVRNIVAALESQGLRWAGQGTFAAIPAASKQGSVYYATDQGKAYYDTGSAWVDMSSLAAGAVGTTQLADHAVTEIKLALLSVGTPELIDAAVTLAKLAASSVDATKIANSLKPSAGAGGATEALRALGTAAGTAAAGVHSSQHQYSGADPLPIEAYQFVTLQPVAAGASWTPTQLKFWKDAAGTVHLHSKPLTWNRAAADLANGSTIATMPAGYRPDEVIRVPFVWFGTTFAGYVNIFANGDIVTADGSWNTSRTISFQAHWRGDA